MSGGRVGADNGEGFDVPKELIARYDKAGPRYTSYPTAPEWHEMDEAAARAALLRVARGEQAVSVYVHIPFCDRMCLFCGCNVVVAKKHDRVPRYLAALEREMKMVREIIGRRRAIQVHLGGGTPTFLTPSELTRLGESIWSSFEAAPRAEVGIEIDPMVTTREHLVAARALGFNRLSMGVQDFADDVQEIIERRQPDVRSSEVFAMGRELGFESINIDLMYGLPGQTPAHLAHSAKRVVELGADRVAIFGYAHVPWMKPHQRKLEERGVPNAEARWAMFNAARRGLLEAGYQAIGFDHFARPDDELALAWRERRLNRNFQGYTVLEPTHLLGFGLSSISDAGGAYLQNAKRLSSYYDAIESGRLATERGRELTEEDALRRALITDLMCNLRVDFGSLGARFGLDVGEHFSSELDALEPFIRDDMMKLGDEGIEVTERGRVFVRNIAMTFDAYLRARSSHDEPRFSRTV